MLNVGAALAVDDRRGQRVICFLVDKGEALGLRAKQVGDRDVQARVQVRLNVGAASNRQVVVADRAEQEGFARLDGARIVRLETNRRLAVGPQLGVTAVVPLRVLRLHPLFAVTCPCRILIPLPGPASSVIGERAAQLGADRLVVSDRLAAVDAGARERGLRHSGHDAVANVVIGITSRRVRLGRIDNARSHARTDGTNIDTSGGGLLGGLRSLGSGDLGDDQRAGRSSHDGQCGQGAGGDSCSLGPRVARARSTCCHRSFSLTFLCCVVTGGTSGSVFPQP